MLSVGNDVISDFNITEGDIIIGRANLQRSLVDTVSGLSINYSDGSSTLLAGISSTGFDAKKAFLDLSDISTIPKKSGGISPESAQDRKKSISHDYLASYADLTTVIGNNLELASKHFYLFAFQEGRSIDRFNNAAYLEANPGVANSAYFRDRASEHFIIYGSKEGRVATIY